ncbi:hypothetical protein RSSM_02766 [Rhodopirellula sallentina SM41]|uniref:Uncharacterized protein n=1 Tax=Rhodopirellula sallentina SM41 TaxID=1263870 RepID=M5U2T9_9BACT|nr:hypothetical protein RSSM_02766 [Rhodopirellula sallentina SM41]
MGERIRLRRNVYCISIANAIGRGEQRVGDETKWRVIEDSQILA